MALVHQDALLTSSPFLRSCTGTTGIEPHVFGVNLVAGEHLHHPFCLGSDRERWGLHLVVGYGGARPCTVAHNANKELVAGNLAAKRAAMGLRACDDCYNLRLCRLHYKWRATGRWLPHACLLLTLRCRCAPTYRLPELPVDSTTTRRPTGRWPVRSLPGDVPSSSRRTQERKVLFFYWTAL